MKKRTKFYFPVIKIFDVFKCLGLLLFVFYALGMQQLSAQNSQDVLDYAKEKLVLHPEESIAIAEKYIQKAGLSQSEKCRVNIIFAEAYMLTQDYDKSIKYLFEVFQQSCPLSEEEKLNLSMMQSDIYQKIDLKMHFEESEKQIHKNISAVEDPELRQLLENKFAINRAYIKLKTSHYAKPDFSIDPNQVVNLKTDKLIYVKYLILKHFQDKKTNLKQMLNEQLPYSEENFNLFYNRYIALADAISLAQEGEEEEAAALLLNTLNALENLDSLEDYKEQIYHFLLDLTIAHRDKEWVAVYRDKQQFYSDMNEQILTNAIAEVFIQKTKSNLYEQNELRNKYDTSLRIIWIIGGGVLILLLGYFLRLIWQEKHYREIVAYIEEMNSKKLEVEVEEKSESEEVPEKTDHKNKLKLSNDAEQQIVLGLKEFEEREEFLQNDISLAYLASSLKMNTKYLSEFLNSKLNENFNGYINRLRIEYVVNKLKNNPEYLKYKISYLAELAGYTSHSSFTTAFKSITGVPPTTFISYLKRKV